MMTMSFHNPVFPSQFQFSKADPLEACRGLAMPYPAYGSSDDGPLARSSIIELTASDSGEKVVQRVTVSFKYLTT